MSAPAKRGRPPRHPIDVLRTRVWFASLKAISGLPSAHAIEMAVCPPNVSDRSQEHSRPPRKFALYANGQRIPRRKGDVPGIVDLSEARFPRSAAAFDCPLWDLFGKKAIDHAWLNDTLSNLLFTSNWPVTSEGDLARPRQFSDDPQSALSDFLAHLESLTFALLFWRLSDSINSLEMRQQAIDRYLMLQPRLERLPELAGSLADELFYAVDTNFPHTLHSGFRRTKIVVLTTSLRASKGGEPLTQRDIDLKIAQLQEDRAH